VHLSLKKFVIIEDGVSAHFSRFKPELYVLKRA